VQDVRRAVVVDDAARLALGGLAFEIGAQLARVLHDALAALALRRSAVHKLPTGPSL
jgi:hypothetical protein